jgi:hypothetical protein
MITKINGSERYIFRGYAWSRRRLNACLWCFVLSLACLWLIPFGKGHVVNALVYGIIGLSGAGMLLLQDAAARFRVYRRVGWLKQPDL